MPQTTTTHPWRPQESSRSGLVLGGAVVAGCAGVLAGYGSSALLQLDDSLVAVAVALPLGAAAGWLAITNFARFVWVVFAVRASLDLFDLDVSRGAIDPSAAIGAMFVLTASLWLVAQRQSGNWVPVSRATLALAVLAAVGFASAVGSADRALSGTAAIEVLAGVLMFPVLEQLLAGRPDRVKVLLVAVLGSAIFPAAVGIEQWLTTDETSGFTNVARVTGTFVHPNPFATYLVMVFLLAVTLAMASTGRRRIALWSFVSITGLLIVVTFTRAGWLAAIVGLLYLGLRRNKALLVGLIVAILALVLTVPSVTTRISDLNDEVSVDGVPANSLEWRIDYWGDLTRLSADSRMVGVGLDTVPELSPVGLEPHNIYVQAYVEAGAIGLAALVVAIGAVAVRLRARARAASTEREKTLATAAIAIGLAMLVQTPTENLLTQTLAFWYFAGAATWGFSETRRVRR